MTTRDSADAVVRSWTAGRVVIRGADEDFCAGGDVHALARLHSRGRAAMAELFDAFARALRAVTSAGPRDSCRAWARGRGGFELMQACDIAITRSDARIADIHSRFGQVPGGDSRQPPLPHSSDGRNRHDRGALGDRCLA